MAQYLQQSQQQHQNNQLKGHAGSIVDRPHLYWPGLQGLVANPMAWRDRLTGTSKYRYFYDNLSVVKCYGGNLWRRLIEGRCEDNDDDNHGGVGGR